MMSTRVHRAVSAPELNLQRTFTLQKVGASDPTAALVPRQFEKVHLSMDGRVVHHHVVIVDDQLHHTTTILDDRVHPVDDGEGLRLRLDADDDGAGRFAELAARHEVTHLLHRQHRGLRLLPVPWLFDVAASVILQQRVRFIDAVRSFSAIAKRFGPLTPLGRCFPHPRVIAGLAADELMPLGVDGQRARALKAIAIEALHSDLFHPLPADNVEATRAKLEARLARAPGVGPWTTAMIMGFGFGDSDAVVTGDLHLPHLVTRVLGGDDDGSDARMVALLAPFVGHRFRVTRLLWAARLGKRPTVPGPQATRSLRSSDTDDITAHGQATAVDDREDLDVAPRSSGDG